MTFWECHEDESSCGSWRNKIFLHSPKKKETPEAPGDVHGVTMPVGGADDEHYQSKPDPRRSIMRTDALRERDEAKKIRLQDPYEAKEEKKKAEEIKPKPVTTARTKSP